MIMEASMRWVRRRRVLLSLVCDGLIKVERFVCLI